MGTHNAITRPGDQSPAYDSKPGRGGNEWLSKLDSYECRVVLAAESVGRIGWASASGQIILPVTYIYVDSIIGFRTAPYGALSELIRVTPVAFEVDSLDCRHNEGVSVLVQGLTHAAQQPDGSPPEWSESVVPWAGGRRHLAIEVSIQKITGRRIRRYPTG